MRLKLKPIIGNILFAAVVLLILSHFLFVYLDRPFPISVVSSESMEPELYKGDIIVWTPTRAEDIHVGDIIVYQSYMDKTKLVSHRVVNITTRNGQYYFTTKGDANNYTDQKGPHAVEPLIGSNHLLGRVLSVNQHPLKIPYIGKIWLKGGESKTGMVEHVWGTPESEVHQGVFICFVVAVIIIITGLIAWKPKSDDKARLTDFIFGPEKLQLKRVLSYALVLYVALLLITPLFAYSKESASVGVNLGENPPVTGLYFEDMKENQSMTREYDVRDPGILPIKCIAFSHGNISDYMRIDDTVYILESRQSDSKKVTVFIPEGTRSGVYTGDVYVYSTPFWIIFPDDFMEYMVEWDPMGAVICFNLISAFLLSVVSIIVLFTMSRLIDEYIIWRAHISWYPGLQMHLILIPLYNFWCRLTDGRHRVNHGFRRCFSWLSNIDWIEIKTNKPLAVSLLALFFIPLTLIGRPFLAILTTSLIVSIATYLVGCRWRAGIFLSGLTGGAIIITLLALISISSFPPNLAPLMLIAITSWVIAIFLLIFAVLFLPICAVSYLSTYSLQTVLEKLRPVIMIKGDTDI